MKETIEEICTKTAKKIIKECTKALVQKNKYDKPFTRFLVDMMSHSVNYLKAKKNAKKVQNRKANLEKPKRRYKPRKLQSK